MAHASIEFKGSSFTLSVLHLKTLDLEAVRAALANKVNQAPDFFFLVPLVVNVQQVEACVDYQAIKLLVEEFKFTFVGFTGTIPNEQRKLIRELGFSFVNTAKVQSTEKISVKTEVVEKTTEATVVTPQRVLYSDKVHRGQVRSGQQIYAQDQNLVIIGSVSAGAEVIADGNIHVYGSLRGKAIAGAKGHQHAQIYCQNIEAEMVSINGNYWLSESMEEHWGSAAYIQLTDSELSLSKLN